MPRTMSRPHVFGLAAITLGIACACGNPSASRPVEATARVEPSVSSPADAEATRPDASGVDASTDASP